MADIFLSYASQDRQRIRPLVRILEDHGWSVFWDWNIPPGKRFSDVIEQNLEAAKCVVVVWSESSVKSDWVIDEAEEGKKRRILVPVLIEQVKIPMGFRGIQGANLINWGENEANSKIEILCEAIRSIIDEPKSSENPIAQHEPPTSIGAIELSPFEFSTIELNEMGKIVSRSRKSAKFFIEDLDGVELHMVYVPGGAFVMGAPEDERGSMDRENPLHDVTLSTFYMGKFTITQEQWRTVASWPSIKHEINPEPSLFEGSNRPVERVSWFDAVEFCARLTQKLKRKRKYRLPTEAEWEYACRAGTSTPFAIGKTITPEFVNYDGTRPYDKAPRGKKLDTTLPVGNFEVANAYGLFDMHGNVWEWCRDFYDEYFTETEPENDPTGPEWGKERIMRGGSYSYYADDCRSAFREYSSPDNRDSIVGLRVITR